MFRWAIQSRFRTALTVLAFCVVFALSVLVLLVAFAADARFWGVTQIPAMTGLVTAIGSVVGTISTIYLAWRADRRTARESELKLVQMQQQIRELEAKLSEQTPARRVILP